MVLTLFAFLLTFSMVGLFTNGLFVMAKNITQIDLMKGNYRLNDKDGTHPNPFDFGPFTNISLLFDG